jgi:hypothetical protein
VIKETEIKIQGEKKREKETGRGELRKRYSERRKRKRDGERRR